MLVLLVLSERARTVHPNKIMDKTKHNGLHCLHCEKPLVGQQTKYCSNAHRVAHHRAKKKAERRTDSVTSPEVESEQAHSNDLVLIETRRDLARAEGIVVELRGQRDRLVRERDLALSQVSKLEHENGVLEGKLQSIQVDKPPSNKSPSSINYVLAVCGIAGLVILIVIIFIQVLSG